MREGGERLRRRRTGAKPAALGESGAPASEPATVLDGRQEAGGGGPPPGIPDLLARTLPAMGYEVVDVEMSRGGLVRVFIDKPDGVDVEDCARVSHHLTRLFAVENVDFDRLEISSPGLDRPLTKLADYVRFAGMEAQLTLSAPVAGAKRVKGTVRGTEGNTVLVETAAGMRSLPFETIVRGRLVPKIDWRKGS